MTRPRKRCIVCKIRPVRVGPTKKENRHSYCRKCGNAIGRKNYQDNKARYFTKAKKREREIDRIINTAKGKPCQDCDKSYPSYVMDLDHRNPADKVTNLSNMRRNRMAIWKILAEIEKCDVVCSNCHRERTNKRQPARYTKAA